MGEIELHKLVQKLAYSQELFYEFFYGERKLLAFERGSRDAYLLKIHPPSRIDKQISLTAAEVGRLNSSKANIPQ